jgi:ATP-binding cassette subfamily B protein
MNPSSQNKDKNNAMPLGRASARFASKVKPKSLKATLKRLVKLFAQEKKTLILTIISVLIGATGTLYAPLIIGKAVDALANHNSNQVLTMSAYLLIIYLLVAFTNWFSVYTVSKASQGMIHDLREKLFYKLTRLPLKYFDGHAHGDIMSRFTNDLDAVSQVVNQSTITLITAIFSVLGTAIMMLYLNVILTIGVFLSVPLMFILSKLIASKTVNLFKGQQKSVGKINGIVEESVYGLDLIQAFDQGEYLTDKFDDANEKAFKYGKSAQIWSGLLMPLMNVINNLTFAIIALLGGYLSIKSVISVGVVASFIAYSRAFVRPLNEVAFIYNSLMSAIAGAERVFNVLDEANENINVDGIIKPLKGDISFENVTFGYDPDKPVLKNISFHAKAGQKVAIVGPTGSGKTTLVQLLACFYKAQKGRIIVDGEPIQAYNLAAYLKQLGMVTQDAYLFSGTILENLQYGNLDASQDAIKSAAKMAMADHIIERFPKGYHSHLTFAGMNVSHGERQLMTIARAIMADPKIYILDEATSSVDLKTEKSITRAMVSLTKNRTSLIIAHRLSTIRDADVILVIKDGYLIEKGNHQDLMNYKGFYFEMIQEQMIGSKSMI